MTTEISVRLDDDLVAFADDLVRRGEAPSRADVVARALKREQRRNLADRDAAVLAASCKETDMDGLTDFEAGVSMDDLD